MASNAGPIQRKPVGATRTPTLDTPPPPPYLEHDPKTTRLEGRPLPLEPDLLSPLSSSGTPVELSPPLMSLPIIQTDIPAGSFWEDGSISPSRPLPKLPPEAALPAELPAPVPSELPVDFIWEDEKQQQTVGVEIHRNQSTDSSNASSTNTHHRKLRKGSPEPRRRSNSIQQMPGSYPISEASSYSGVAAPIPANNRGRSVSAHPTLAITPAIGDANIVPSLPASQSTVNNGTSQSPSRGRVRRSWMPGNRSRSNSVDVGSSNSSQAWVMGEEGNSEYNTTFLKNGDKVPELWNESGTVLVFLFPKSSGCGPSFKIPEFTIASSYVFNELIAAEQESLGSSSHSRAKSFGGRDSLAVEDANRMLSPPMSRMHQDFPGDLRLYLPVSKPTASDTLSGPPGGEGTDGELERLVGIRNLFAFLTGQPLVATKTRPTMFKAFLQIASLLDECGFMAADGPGFGQEVDLSFGFYCDQLGLSDCRSSREKTIEALILGERMRCMDLYSEAFAHAAGKYSAIMDLRLPLYEMLSPRTRQRLERAHIDLLSRQHNVNEHLEQFDFPSIFAGIANSTSMPELKQVRFKVWRASFSKMRQFILSYYKGTFGSWPPKANSKKNPFAESGLNRLVLKLLYSDMCALYDLLVDRETLTSRIIDHAPSAAKATEKAPISALRNVLSEFDRSRPPVLPPIPFDVPQSPSMSAVLETYGSLSAKEQAKFDKKLKEHEFALILNKAYNYDTNSIKLPFLDQFKDFELKEAKGKTAQDLVDQRFGYWLFLYAVLQSLPMLVVDAPGLKFTEGTEYFLCEPIMGQPPWAEDGQVRKMWYEVAGGGGLVELSADAVMFSVEATYHRSHCWLAAKQWEGIEGADTPPPNVPAMSPLQPPRPMFESIGGTLGGGTPPIASAPSPPPGAAPSLAIRTRNLSPARHRANHSWRSSIAIGLEPVPMDQPNIYSPSQHTGSLGGRQPSGQLNGRSASSGNLIGLAGSPRTVTTPLPSATSSTTFDDMLGVTDKKKSKPVTKKRSRFF